MKKYLSIFLSLILILSFAACSETTVEESADSSAESSLPIGISSEAQESSEGFVMSEKVGQIRSFLGEEVDRTLLAKNVFKGLTYTPSRSADDDYSDQGNHKLTDGLTHEIIYNTHTYAAWSGTSAVSITFDLGEGEHAIGDISVGCAQIKDYSSGLPDFVSIRVSDDNKNYVDIGKVMRPADIPDTARYIYYFSFPQAITARYVRIVYAKQANFRLMTDEIIAYEYCEDGIIDPTLGKPVDQTYTINDFYGYELNLGESNVKVSENDADYNEVQNLAQLDGVEFDVDHFDPFFAEHTNSGMEKIGLLTDGKRHSSDIEGDYFIFYRGAGRHVVADLGAIMAVQGCTVTFQDRISWGIATPPVYYISVSENGTDWVTVFAEHNPDYGKKSRLDDTREISFADTYRARYVRITFATVPDNTVSCSVYMGEWEIWGKKNPDGAKTAEPDLDIIYGRYQTPEEYGISDILFAGISDKVGEHSTGYHVITEDTAYHYLATVDENGKANGLLYDSFAFTTRGEISWMTDRNESFEWFLDELFYEGENLDAVDAAKARVNEELGLTDKATVWISVNCPVIGDTWNGKIIKTAEDYIECLKWMADTAAARFEAENYQHIKLAGFYWQVENLRPNYYAPDEAHDIEAAIAFNAYVHEKGMLTLWCPYYNHLNGIWHSKYYGFDITCWQPNTMFSPSIHTQMRTISELAKLYGVGLEIEIEPNRQSKESLALYREYLGYGYEYGFMHAINAYYQGAVPGAHVLYRDDSNELNKTIYDETVLYMQGKLNYNPMIKPAADLSAFTDGEMTLAHNKSASVSIGEIGELDVRFVQSPLYGTVRLDQNGTLTYNAMKGYAGEDMVVIAIYDGVGEIKTVTVKVTVTEE